MEPILRANGGANQSQWWSQHGFVWIPYQIWHYPIAPSHERFSLQIKDPLYSTYMRRYPYSVCICVGPGLCLLMEIDPYSISDSIWWWNGMGWRDTSIFDQVKLFYAMTTHMGSESPCRSKWILLNGWFRYRFQDNSESWVLDAMNPLENDVIMIIIL